MSSGNITTEYTRREHLEDQAVIEAAALVRNDVLRRALAIAAYEYALQHADHCGHALQPDAGIGLMVCWVIRATEEIESAQKAR